MSGRGEEYVLTPMYTVLLTMLSIDTCQDLLDYVSKNSGEEIDVSSMWSIVDPLISEVKQTS